MEFYNISLWILVSFLEAFIEIFMSLLWFHEVFVTWYSLFIVLKYCNDIWICIGMRIHGFNIKEMIHGIVALQEWYEIMVDNIRKIDWYVGSVHVKLQVLSLDILFMGTVGPWVKVPKALEEDTLMWVYGVGDALRF